MSMPNLDRAALDDLNQWLNTIPFSKGRKNMARDFSDGSKNDERIFLNSR